MRNYSYKKFEKDTLSLQKRLAVFASYDKDCKISEYVIYYLTELKKVVDTIVFVSDNFVSQEETEKINHLVAKTFCKKHGGYDFTSYKLGYQWLLEQKLLDSADELLFLNDSVYGPIFPLQEVFSTMEKKPCNFWGLLESYEPVHHILSFFMVFRKEVFLSSEFCSFVSSFTVQKDFWDYVNLYERRFTLLLENKGFHSDVYVDIDKSDKDSMSYKSGNGNITSFPHTAILHGFPFVKRKVFNGSFGYDLHESPNLVMKEIKGHNRELYDIIKKDIEANGWKQEDRWLLPEQIIYDAEVVSFDVFDTLLARPFLQPTDLFRYMEKELECVGYAKERIKAEERARVKHRKQQADVTLKQIYEEIAHQFKHLEQEELRYEKDLLFSCYVGKSIYEEAVRQGKRIIAISDMYLPKTFICEVLKKNGYTAIHEVFVSNEENACKGGGKLFKRVLEEMNISPCKMVHVGDNEEADKQSPQALGIRAYHLPSYREQIKNLPSLARLHKELVKQGNVLSSLLLGLIAHHKCSIPLPNAMKEFGYELGGPFAIGYLLYLHKVAIEREVDGIIFVSRDGYALHKIYDIIFPNDSIKTYYVQASRKLILRNNCQYNEEKYVEEVYTMYAKECLGKDYINPKDYKKYAAGIRAWCQTNSHAYEKYIEGLEISGNKLMTVDMTTYSYTSLTLLHKVLGDRIDCGMFSTSAGKPCQYTYMTYSEEKWTAKDVPLIMLQEELITAPEYTAYKVNEHGKWFYTDYHPVERERIRTYQDIMAGVMEFAKEFAEKMTGHYINIPYDTWKNLAESYIQNRNYGTIEVLNNIWHEDAIDKSYNRLSDVFYSDHLTKEEAPTTWNYLELTRLQGKQIKHLKTIRRLLYTLGGGIIVILYLLVSLLSDS